jgi:hypothetical protein
VDRRAASTMTLHAMMASIEALAERSLTRGSRSLSRA